MSILAIRRCKFEELINITVRGYLLKTETVDLTFDQAEELVADLSEMLHGNLVQVDHVPLGGGTIRKHDREVSESDIIGALSNSKRSKTISEAVQLFLPALQPGVRGTIRKMVDEGRLKLVNYKLKVVNP